MLSVVIVGGAVAAVHLEKLPPPRTLPEPVKYEAAARLGTVAMLALSMPLALLPHVAPSGAYPLLLAVCCSCAVLLRDPRAMVAVGTLALLVACRWPDGVLIELVSFSVMSSLGDTYFAWDDSAHARRAPLRRCFPAS